MENNQKEIILLKDLGTLYPTNKSKHKVGFAIYKCFCGNEFKAQKRSINSNNTKSCGCLTTTHGLKHHRLYSIWSNMIQRCNNINHKRFSDYGGRGITVCDEWLDIQNFINDMFPSYQEGLSIDRIDNNGNYELSNCRWTIKQIQARNTRTLKSNNTSGYRGVYWNAKLNKWASSIRINSKSIYLGLFNNALDAAKAYNYYVNTNNLEHTINNL